MLRFALEAPAMKAMKLLSRVVPMGVVVVCAAVPLHAELRVRSVVEVTQQRQKQAGFGAQISLSLVPFRAALGKADVVTVAARGSVRVDGLGPVLGLPADAVLISTPDGRTVCMLPSTGEFFWMPVATPATYEPFFKVDSRVRRRGDSDVLLGQKTDRVSVNITVMPKLPKDDGMVYAGHARPIHTSQLMETDAQRVARETLSGKVGVEFYKQEPISIDSWESGVHGPLGALIASAGSNMTSFATAGLVSLTDRQLALRQVIVNPTWGYRVESRVTAVEMAVVDDAVFRVPAEYREIPAPSRR